MNICFAIDGQTQILITILHHAFCFVSAFFATLAFPTLLKILVNEQKFGETYCRKIYF